jgi:hypothetical protein
MSDLFSSLLIFTIIKTILSTFFFTVSNFYKNLVNWALTEIESSVAGTTTLDREWGCDMTKGKWRLSNRMTSLQLNK